MARYRYEIKYILDPHTASLARERLLPFLRHDRHCTNDPHRRYAVSSLYLDSPSLRLASSTIEGELQRVKLRIRRYVPLGQAEYDGPLFFEIKHKKNGLIHKQRAIVPADIADMLLDSDAPLVTNGRLPEKDKLIVNEFQRLRMRYSAQPVVNVHYMREAYESKLGDGMRVTFDHRLTASPWSLDAPFGTWPGRPADIDGIVLELKFTKTCPRWAFDCLDPMNLIRRAVPKYVLCLKTVGAVGGTPRITVTERFRMNGKTVPVDSRGLS